MLAVSRMAAFETEIVESCRLLGMVPANLFHPISLVGIRPECASSGLWQPVEKQTLAGS
jgi:hypothetical protein